MHSVALRLAFEPRCRCRCPALGRVHSKGAAARATVSGQTSSHWAALWLVFDYLTCVFGGELGHIQAWLVSYSTLARNFSNVEQRIARTRAVALIGFGQSGNLSEPSRGLSLYVTYKNPKLQRFAGNRRRVSLMPKTLNTKFSFHSEQQFKEEYTGGAWESVVVFVKHALIMYRSSGRL